MRSSAAAIAGIAALVAHHQVPVRAVVGCITPARSDELQHVADASVVRPSAGDPDIAVDHEIDRHHALDRIPRPDRVTPSHGAVFGCAPTCFVEIERSLVRRARRYDQYVHVLIGERGRLVSVETVAAEEHANRPGCHSSNVDDVSVHSWFLLAVDCKASRTKGI